MKKFLTPGTTRPLVGGFKRTNGVAGCIVLGVVDIVVFDIGTTICGADTAELFAVSSIFMVSVAISLVSAVMLAVATGVDVTTSLAIASGTSDAGNGLGTIIFSGSLLCLSIA